MNPANRRLIKSWKSELPVCAVSEDSAAENESTTMEFKHYQNEDYEAVCDFLIALNEKDRMHVNWNWARFEWMAEHPEFDKSLIASIGLWLDKSRVVGAAIYDMYFGEAFCGVLPDYSALYPQVLDYAWLALRDENGLGIAIREDNAREIEAAKAAGFFPAEQTETMLCMDLEEIDYPLAPEGFHIAELDPYVDPVAFQWLIWQGFDHGEDRSVYEREELVPVLRRRHFNPALSLCAADERGEGKSYCCMWYLPGTDYAYVEPVCTVPSARGKGLAAALLKEALRRAEELGARKAYVISDQTFYKKLGFRRDSCFRFYWKKPFPPRTPNTES